MQTLTDNTKAPKSPFLSQIELILYSSDLCYHGMQIIRDEIQVKNRDAMLQGLTDEISRLDQVIGKDRWKNADKYLTKKQQKENFKKFGITKKSLEY